MKNNRYIYRFIVVGVSGFILNSLVLIVTVSYFGLGKVVAEIIAMIIALQLTFALHDRWTYISEGEAKDPDYSFSLARRYRTYLASNSFGSVLTVVLFSVFSRFMPRLDALAVSAIISMVWNFIMNKLIVWRKTVIDIAD